MAAPPKTVLVASPEEAEAIRAAVRGVKADGLTPGRVIAQPEHAPALYRLLSDPALSKWIYDLPQPITPDTVAAWIDACEAERRAGEGLLTLSLDKAGEVVGYLKFTVWPERSSAESGGGVRADRQNSGRSSLGAGHMFDWMFETLGVRMIGVTAAKDNVRSTKMIDAAGMTRMGERDCIRPDGSVRPSYYWEMTREAWRRRAVPSP